MKYTPRLAAKGYSHHLLLPIIAIGVVGCIGAYLTFSSKAAPFVACPSNQNWDQEDEYYSVCYSVYIAPSLPPPPFCDDGQYPALVATEYKCTPQFKPTCPASYYYDYHYIGSGKVGDLTCRAPTGGDDGGTGPGTGTNPGGSGSTPTPTPTPPPISKSCNPHTTVKAGSKGGCVAHAQDLLNKAKLGSLTVDGVYGPATMAAIKNLEKKYGSTQNGEITATDWNNLHKAANGTPVPTVTYLNIHDKAYGCSVPRPVLTSSYKHNCVSYLQFSLNHANVGSPGLSRTGLYNATTETYLKKFQEKYGLKVDGIVGSSTWAKIDALATNREKKTGEKYNNIHAAAYKCSYPYPTLKVNDKHDCASYLQYSLNHADVGSPGLSRTGLYNATTETYLKRFQEKSGLKVDGIVGSSTWTKIDDLGVNQEQL